MKPEYKETIRFMLSMIAITVSSLALVYILESLK